MLFHFAYEAAGAAEAPGIPCALCFRKAKMSWHNSGESSSEKAKGCSGSSLRAKAKQSIWHQERCGLLRRLWLLAMTGLNHRRCLKILNPFASSRTSEHRERDPGPIITDVDIAKLKLQLSSYKRWWLWVPAFAGTTKASYPAPT